MLKHLFQPIRIGKMEVKNRLAMSPMGVNFGVDEDGYVTEQLTEYFAARSKGGTGMITVGGGCIYPSGKATPKSPLLTDDKFIPALIKMTDRIHEYGAKFGMQMLHGGQTAQVRPEVMEAASPIPLSPRSPVPIGITEEVIGKIIEAHGEGARICKEAGFDFVEIHASHGYLFGGFGSSKFNKRNDKYGGPFENRIRFLVETLVRVREKVGDDFTVGVKFNGDDYSKGQWTLEDSKKLAPILQQNGADYLNISAGVYASSRLTIPPMYEDLGCFVYLAEEIKKEVSIPVLTVGRIKDPVLADRIIKEGRADVVIMGRAHIADPEIARKAMEGRLADIRPCLSDILGCFEQAGQGGEASCVMNPAVNREYILKDQGKASILKKVLVIGAGPAGLGAARRAAKRGHTVIVCEEKGYVGGMLNIASLPPKRIELMALVKYYARELSKLNVEVRLNTPVTEEIIDEIKPDAVVIASGSLPDVPQREGMLDTEMEVSTAVDVLEGTVTTGDRVLILGGGQIGVETADYLSEQGREVCVIHPGNFFAEEMAGNDRYYLRKRLDEEGVQLYKRVAIKKFLDKGVVIEVGGKEEVLDGFDNLVLAEGRRSMKTTAELFKGRDIEVHIIGDAKSPRTLLESQTEADEVGRAI